MQDNMRGVERSSKKIQLTRTSGGKFEILDAPSRRRLAVSGAGSQGEGSSIKAIQRDLERIGTGVKPTGKLDEATVRAINGVFGGWDDAPREMATGRLTASQISKNAPKVAKYIRRAVAQMTTFADVNE